jgi:hypothetical protein
MPRAFYVKENIYNFLVYVLVCFVARYKAIFVNFYSLSTLLCIRYECGKINPLYPIRANSFVSIIMYLTCTIMCCHTPAPRRGRGYTVLPLSVCSSVQYIFRRIFLSNCWWQKSDIWSQASYRYTILWVAFLDPSDSYFLFAEERGYHKWTLAHSSSCWKHKWYGIYFYTFNV